MMRRVWPRRGSRQPGRAGQAAIGPFGWLQQLEHHSPQGRDLHDRSL